MNPSGKMRYYPGSPYVADQMAREQDRLRLFELHPADCKILADNFRKLDAHKAEQGERSRGRRVMIDRGDGFDSTEGPAAAAVAPRAGADRPAVRSQGRLQQA